MTQFLSEPAARAMAGDPCKATLKVWRAKRGFPQPIALGGKKLFILHEVEAWLAAQVAKRDDAAAADAGRAASKGVA